MTNYIYKLQFNTGLRSGNGNIEETIPIIYGDTLFSAIINEANNINDDLVNKLIDATKKGNFKLSDAFPFYNDELFLPKPIMFNEHQRTKEKETSENSNKKKLKKINFIPLSKWEDFLNDKSDIDEILELNNKIGNNVLNTKIMKSDSGDNEIYNLAYFRFFDEAGLYFIFSTDDEEIAEDFDDLFYSLSFTGIGGKKSSGFGKFSFYSMEASDELNNKINKINKEKSMLLTTSTYANEEKEKLIDSKFYYQLVRRGGFIYSTSDDLSKSDIRRRKDLFFFKSGSVFEKEYTGELIELEKISSHPIFRYSIPIWMEV